MLKVNSQNRANAMDLPFPREDGVMPADVRELFDTTSDSDSDRPKHKKSSQESIIFDEEYEIFCQAPLPLETSGVGVCPFCYQAVPQKLEQLIYSSFLDQYYRVHQACCSRFQSKDLGFKLHAFQSQDFLRCESASPTIEPTLTTLDTARVFVELAVYHPVSSTPLIKLNQQASLQHRRQGDDGIVHLDVALLEMQNRLYQPKRIYIPFLEGRVQASIFIFDSCMSKTNHEVVFYFNVAPRSGKVVLRSTNKQVLLKGIVEEKSIVEMQNDTSFAIDAALASAERILVLNVKSITFTFPDMMKNRNMMMTPLMTHRATPLFTPKTQPITPPGQPASSPGLDVGVSRGRLPSFNLNEESTEAHTAKVLEEMMTWTEDITNIEQIRGYIAGFVKTQQGSRLIQKFFATCTQADLDVIIKEVEDQIPDLMIDPYANYLFGSLSQSCVPHQRVHILRIISPRLMEIACDKKGTHAVQALVSLISSRQEEELIEKAIRDHVVQLVFDSQGTHLIKKIISRFSEDKLGFVVEKLMDYFIQVVNHQYGLCVLKDLMTKFKHSGDKSSLILKKMLLHIDEIIQDPYGNYAIQHAMDVYGDQACGAIIERTLQKIVQLSIHKYSSNVVEKCILETTYPTKRKFVMVLSKEDVNLELMKNKFGSFVLQKALSVAKSDKLLFSTLLSSLYRNLSQLYAANIRQKWQDYLDNVSMRKCTLP